MKELLTLEKYKKDPTCIFTEYTLDELLNPSVNRMFITVPKTEHFMMMIETIEEIEGDTRDEPFFKLKIETQATNVEGLTNFRYAPNILTEMIRIPLLKIWGHNDDYEFDTLEKSLKRKIGITTAQMLSKPHYRNQYLGVLKLYESYNNVVSTSEAEEEIEKRGKFYSLYKGNKVTINEPILDYYIECGADDYIKYKDYIGKVGVVHAITNDRNPTDRSSMYLHTVKFGDEEHTFTSTMLDEV